MTDLSVYGPVSAKLHAIDIMVIQPQRVFCHFLSLSKKSVKPDNRDWS
jgi:hypothetical protein